MEAAREAHLNEQELVARACRGDREAYGVLVTRYSSMVTRSLYYRVGDRDEAEDLEHAVELVAVLTGDEDDGREPLVTLERVHDGRHLGGFGSGAERDDHPGVAGAARHGAGGRFPETTAARRASRSTSAERSALASAMRSTAATTVATSSTTGVCERNIPSAPSTSVADQST